MTNICITYKKVKSAKSDINSKISMKHNFKTPC